MTKWKIVLGAAVSALAMVGVVWQFVIPSMMPETFYGHVMPADMAAPAIELEGPGGDKISLTDFEGQVVALFFGYTYCPDICPTSLARLARAQDMLGEDGDQIQVVMITVDPDRDTRAVLDRYVTHFDDSFIGLRGPLEDIERVADVFGVQFEAVETTSAVGYLINHTASVIVIDKNGDWKLVLSFNLTDKQVASDLAKLIG